MNVNKYDIFGFIFVNYYILIVLNFDITGLLV